MSHDEEALLSAQLDKGSVVLVDDDQDYAALFMANAEHMGIKPVVIANSMRVIPALIKSRHRAKLLVTDLQMPILDGLDIAAELKALGSPVMVIIVTNDLNSVQAQQAKALGYDIREKPISVAGFRALLAVVCSDD